MKKSVAALFLILSLVGAVWSIYHTLHPKPPPLKVGPFQFLGEIAGHKVIDLTGGQGDLILWHAKFPIPTERFNAITNGFHKAIKQSTGLTIIADEHDSMTPDPMSGEFTMCQVEGDRLMNLCQKYSQAKLLCFFGGYPDLKQLNPSPLPNPCPKFFIIQLGDVALDKRIFTHPLFGGAIVPRREAPKSSPKTDAERFEAYYEFIPPP